MHDALTGSVPLNNWLGIIGVLSLMYWGWRIIAALMQYSARRRNPVTTPAAPPVETVTPAPGTAREGAPAEGEARESAPAEDIVVIAAAVQAMLGAVHIVHFEPSSTGQTWAMSGRWMHQTSHNLR